MKIVYILTFLLSTAATAALPPVSWSDSSSTCVGNRCAIDFGTWDNGDQFLGIQQATPLAPVHVTGATGSVLAAPASASASLTLDSPVDSPSSYTVTQFNGPPPPTISTTTLIYIEAATGGTATQNTGETGYIATGQTITYQLYSYKLSSNNTRIVNPNFYTMTMQDLLNDGSPFAVDLTGLTTTGLTADGYILYKSDDQGYGPYWIDLPGAGPIDYTDDGYTNQDDYAASAYQSGGLNWSTGLAIIDSTTGTPLRTEYTTNPTADDSSGNYFIIRSTWPAPSGGTYIAQTNDGNFLNVGTDTSADDWGQSDISDAQSFNNVAFQNFNTSLSNGSESSATQNDAETGYIADGSFSTHYYFVAEYRTNVVNGTRYFTTGYSFTFTDNGDDSAYAVDISLNPGDGDGRVLLYSIDGGSTYSQGVDLGGGTDYTDDNTAGTAPAVTPLISSYSGITRNFSLYGYITSPSTKYSSTHNDKTFTDDNSQPYLIKHTYSGLGNASDGKILESSYRNVHVTPDIPGGTTYQGPGNAGGDTGVVPASLGYTASGQVVDYHVFATKGGIYSSGFADASVTFPNDGLAYFVTLTNASVSGATYKARRTIDAGSPVYQTYSSSPFQDDITTAWDSTSTLTPTTNKVTALIAERGLDGTFTDPPIATFRNTNSSTLKDAFNEFDYNTGSSYSVAAKYGVNSSGNFFIAAQNQGLEVGALGSTHTRFQAGQTVFNLLSTTYEWFVRGVTIPYLLYVHSQGGSDGVNIGSNTGSTTGSLLDVKPNGSRAGLAVTESGSAASNIPAFIVESSSGTPFMQVDQSGHVAVGTSSGPTTSALRVGPGDSSHAQVLLENTTTAASVAGGLVRYDNNGFTTDANPIGSQLLFTDKNLHTYPILTAVDPSTGGAGNSAYFWKTGTNGLPVPEPHLSTNSADNILIISGIQTEFKQSVSTDNGISVTVGGPLSTVAGTGGGSINVGGTKFNHFTDGGNVTTGETTLYTDTLAANFLSTNGNAVNARYSGILVGSTSTKQIREYLDGTLIFDSTALAVPSSGHWDISTMCMRDTTTTARCTTTATIDGTSATYSAVNYTLVTVANWTASRILKVTGTAASTGAATNDIVGKLGKVEWIP